MSLDRHRSQAHRESPALPLVIGTPAVSCALSVLTRGCRNRRGVPTKKGTPRPLLLPRDGLRAPAHVGVVPHIAFCYADNGHKGRLMVRELAMVALQKRYRQLS